MPIDEGANLVLEHLRAIRAGQDAIREDIREIKGRLVVLDGGAFATLSAAYGGVSSRLDRIEFRLDRIEQRLGLVEAE
jgi:hypothetical protein